MCYDSTQSLKYWEWSLKLWSSKKWYFSGSTQVFFYKCSTLPKYHLLTDTHFRQGSQTLLNTHFKCTGKNGDHRPNSQIKTWSPAVQFWQYELSPLSSTVPWRQKLHLLLHFCCTVVYTLTLWYQSLQLPHRSHTLPVHSLTLSHYYDVIHALTDAKTQIEVHRVQLSLKINNICSQSWAEQLSL